MSDFPRASNDVPSVRPNRAIILWDFVRKQKPWFTETMAQEILDDLPRSADETGRSLGRQLQVAFSARSIKLKLTDAQQVAAKLLRATSWHSLAQRDAPPHLLCRVTGAADEPYGDWASVQSVMRACVANWRVSDPTSIFWVGLIEGERLVLSAMEPRGSARAQETVLLEVMPLEGTVNWLDGAAGALEGLRRFIEQDAVLDGVAALSACLAVSRPDDSFLSFDNIGNAQLVVTRGGAEFARGDELACFSEIGHALRQDGRYGPPLRGEPVLEGNTWRFGDEVLVWHLQQVRKGMVGIDHSRAYLPESQCASLYKRYQRTRRVFKDAPPMRGGRRLLPHSLRELETSRAVVDVSYIEEMLSVRGCSWAQVCEAAGLADLALAETMPSAALSEIAKYLNLSEPSLLFKPPAKNEFFAVDAPVALNVYYDFADQVRFRRPTNLNLQEAQALEAAIENFANTWQMGKDIGSGVMTLGQNWVDAPHQAYAAEAEEFFNAVSQLGLVLTVTLARTFILRTGEDVFKHQSFPYRHGMELLLRIDRRA